MPPSSSNASNFLTFHRQKFWPWRFTFIKMTIHGLILDLSNVDKWCRVMPDWRNTQTSSKGKSARLLRPEDLHQQIYRSRLLSLLFPIPHLRTHILRQIRQTGIVCRWSGCLFSWLQCAIDGYVSFLIWKHPPQWTTFSHSIHTFLMCPISWKF